MTERAKTLLLVMIGLLIGHLLGTLTPPEYMEGMAIGALCVGCFVLGMEVEHLRIFWPRKMRK